MPTTYRPYSPNQQPLLPQNPANWIEPGDLSHYVNDLVDQMDLSGFTAVYDGDGRRNQPYHPAVLLKVIIYGYATGVFSSRKLEQKMKRDVAFQMLAAENFPSYRTLSRFRQQHLGEIKNLFLQVLRLARETGSAEFGNLAIGGTKVRANASKRKTMNFEYMERADARLKGEIAKLLEQAQSVDESEEEDTTGAASSSGLSKEPSIRKNRLKQIQAAKRTERDTQMTTVSRGAGSGIIRHGDFLQIGKRMVPRKFSVIIADPPYNIGKDFGNDSDCQPMEAYLEWTDKWVELCKELLSNAGVLYIYGFSEILARIAARHPIKSQRWLVWHYTNKTVPHLKFWQRSHESILCLWRDKRPDLQIDQIREGYTDSYLKCIGRPRKSTEGRYSRVGVETTYNGHECGALPRDVIKIPALAGGAGRNERWFVCRSCGHRLYSPDKLSLHISHDVLKHPTQKPMALTRRLLLSAVSDNGGSVLVPFAGSGSECVVAQYLGIDFMGVELNGEYARFARKWLARQERDLCIA